MQLGGARGRVLRAASTAEVRGDDRASSSTSRSTSRSGCAATRSSTSARGTTTSTTPRTSASCSRVAEKCYLPMNAPAPAARRRARGARSAARSRSPAPRSSRWRRGRPRRWTASRRLAAHGLRRVPGRDVAPLARVPDRRRGVPRPGARRRPTASSARSAGARRRSATPSSSAATAVAQAAEELGFTAILGEGADHLLGWRSPHRVYRPEGCERIKLLLRSYRLSDDIAFRFSNRAWAEWPLTADKFARLGRTRLPATETRRRPVHGLRDLRRAPVEGDRASSTSWTHLPGGGARAPALRVPHARRRSRPRRRPRGARSTSPTPSRGPTPSAT